MKKILPVLFFCMIPFSSSAQILHIARMTPTLVLPLDFLDSLEQCEPYEDSQSGIVDHAEAILEYKIVPDLQEKKCLLHITAQMDHYVHLEQDCKLPLETAAEYAVALRKFMAQKYSLTKETYELNRDENYKIASNIMQNSDLCHFIRRKIDNTKDIRENLPNCQRIISEEKMENAKIIRQIAGRDENFNCRYYYTLWIPKPDLSSKTIKSEKLREQLEKISDIEFRYVCSLDDSLKKEYIMLLESLVLPQEEGYDFTSVNTFSRKIETDFITEHCEYDTAPVKK